MIRLVVEPSANLDLKDARDWYNNERRGLGEEFLAQVRNMFSRIETYPEAYPEVEGGVRFAILVPYPYKIFYIVREASAHVIAVIHSARAPHVWKRRLNGFEG